MKKPPHVNEAPGDSLDMVAEQDRQLIEIFTGWDATTRGPAWAGSAPMADSKVADSLDTGA
jgi:hypothetical protein